MSSFILIEYIYNKILIKQIFCYIITKQMRPMKSST